MRCMSFALTGPSNSSIQRPHRSDRVTVLTRPAPPAPLWPQQCHSPPWMLSDKVIQRQLRALISGLNPVSVGASLSRLPPPGLLSSCPTPTAWLTIWRAVAKTKCLPLYYCRLLDNILPEAVYLFPFFSPLKPEKQSNCVKMNRK